MANAYSIHGGTVRACSVDSHRAKSTKHAREQGSTHRPSVCDPYGAHHSSRLQSGELPGVLSIVAARLAALRAADRLRTRRSAALPPFVALCGIAHSQKLFSSFNTLSIIYVAPPLSVPPSASVSRAAVPAERERTARRRRREREEGGLPPLAVGP